ncbi:hypothetical protein [Halostreptopolyspora alba]|uniref:DNA-binding protein n=1 Tax=Halostreptopolyspora alba TaxID=2487137 RepID=A0A3N0E3M7_9ACTN|nr:hypothetical protein EFW17_19255 [Nocardiopsaceae bacterium YIM 96095]
MLDLLPTDPASSCLYLDWVRRHAPRWEGEAERLLSRVNEGIGRALRKPGAFLDDRRRDARRLPPGHLPWFWDTVGHRLARNAPRHAAKSYALAREAELSHALVVETDYIVANAALFARFGALTGTQMSAHQKWLAANLPAERAHAEFAAFVHECGNGGVVPPADLHSRVRDSARSAGLGVEEQARLLGRALCVPTGTAVPNALMDRAARVFARVPPDNEVRAGLAEMFPSGKSGGAAWLRLLRDSGTIEAMANGWVDPPGGLAGWLSRFAYHYNLVGPWRGGVTEEPKPDELYTDVLPRLAGRLRGQRTPVRLHESRARKPVLDAVLVDACLALEIPVENPGTRVEMLFWRPRSALTALAAHPEWSDRFGDAARVERSRETTVTRLPETPGVDREVHERVSRSLDQVADGGLGAAREALSRLDTLLDTPTSAALEGIGEALAGLDLTGPLLRTLRAGIPAELVWPALEEAVAELEREDDPVEGVSCTWPVLTVHGGGRAVAVDHQGRRGACDVTVPEEAASHTVHFVGGDFLVSWRVGSRDGGTHHAYWASAPDAVFQPERTLGLVRYAGKLDGALGHQFATGDGGGRHDGDRVLRPGGREGIAKFEQQMSDGTRMWSSRYLSGRRGRHWAEVDPVTGQRHEEGSLPEFFPTLPDGWVWSSDELSLVRLPDGVEESVLGLADGLSGFRVCHRSDDRSATLPSLPNRYTLEGADGRGANYFRDSAAHGHRAAAPWGIVRMPAGGADLVATLDSATGDFGGMALVPCYAAEDTSLLWEVRLFPRADRGPGPSPDDHPPFPPPAFWHFLRPRDLTSSRALRAVGEEEARALLEAALTAPEGEDAAAVREALGRVLPGVTEPRVVRGVVAAVAQAARLLGHRERLSHRVGIVRSGAVARPPERISDEALVGALRGLVPEERRSTPTGQPATLTALVADGQYLRGAVDDETRRLSRPATPRDWTGLLGGIDAVAWRAASAFPGEDDRAALTALLRAWADHPCAEPGGRWRRGRASGAALAPLCEAGQAVVPGAVEPGPLVSERRYAFLQPVSAPVPEGAEDTEIVTVTRDDAARLRRLLDLLAEHGPLPLDEAAVTTFQRRTGVRRAVAALVLAGLPRRAALGGDIKHRVEAHERMLRAKPFHASKRVARAAERVSRRLGVAGRRRVLAAAVPDDPDELWAPGGVVAAAERMARVWVELLGGQTPVDEDTAEALERDLGQGSQHAAALAEPATSDIATTDMRCVLAADKRGRAEPYEMRADGSRQRIYGFERPYADLATLLAWALTERPTGTPATAGAPELYARLRARLDAPELLLPLGLHGLPGDPEGIFGPDTHPVEPPEEPREEGAAHPVAYDNGLLVVDGTDGFQRPLVRPSGFADPEALERTLRVCHDHGLHELRADLERVRVCYDGGLARMVRRTATTPVPAGGYEANPRLSVPDLVDTAAGELGVGADAAALYLQLLTLARPTDRNVRTWNGWTAARHKAARAELLDRGLVIQDNRSRAGRSVFPPGGWTVLKTPELPLETVKLDTHMVTVNDNKEIEGPFTRLLAPAPLHEMFAAAWEAR